MSKRFFWKDRAACIRRIFVTMKCMGYDADKAIEKALHMTDASGYRFCGNPGSISIRETERLRRDVQACHDQQMQFNPQWQPITRAQLDDLSKGRKPAVAGPMRQAERGAM